MEMDKGEVIMVGDRVSSDVKGAKEFGIRSVLVRTGEFDERDLDGTIEPDFILDSVKDVLVLVE